MMHTDVHDALAFAHRVGHELREQAAAERSRRPAERRGAFAASLRRCAARLDPTPPVRTTASHS